MAPGTEYNSRDIPQLYAQVARRKSESTPKTLEGILDMMGPRTLEGGNSPSQDISSAIFKAVVEGCSTRTNAVTEVFVVSFEDCIGGAKAEAAATIATKTKVQNLFILMYVK